MDTSDQMYQMRDKFDNALSASLSNHDVHEETLRRIERYSITSLQTSAHSIKSMESIRTELSRLEAMITANSKMERPTPDSFAGPSGQTDQPGGPEPGSKGYFSEILKDAGVAELEGNPDTKNLDQRSSSASNYSSNASSVIHAGARMRFRTRTRPAELQDLVKEQEGISKRFSEISNGHESALLYAQFSRPDPPTSKGVDVSSQEVKQGVASNDLSEGPPLLKPTASSSPRPPEDGPTLLQDSSSANKYQRSPSARTSISQRVESRMDGNSYRAPQSETPEVDHHSTYSLLDQTLAALYPTKIARYISLQNVIFLHGLHLHLLEELPDITSKKDKHAATGHPKYPESHARKLRDQLEVLQIAADKSSRECTEAGYSLSELDDILLPVASRTSVPKRTAQDVETTRRLPNLGIQSSPTQDTFSDESDAYFSSAE